MFVIIQEDVILFLRYQLNNCNLELFYSQIILLNIYDCTWEIGRGIVYKTKNKAQLHIFLGVIGRVVPVQHLAIDEIVSSRL